MSGKWRRDSTFRYESINTRQYELTDEDIERLREKPGHLERLFRGVISVVSRRDHEEEHEVVAHPGATLYQADFSRRQLRDADFCGANLQRAVFTGALLPNARFVGADLREANLAEAVLTGADLRNADLSGANLIGTDFDGADLRGANLTGAYIWGADFHDSDVQGAIFTGAFAGGALFSHARNLTLEQFRSTIHDETGAYRLSMLPDPPSSKKR